MEARGKTKEEVKPYLCNSEEETADNKALEIFNNTRQGQDHTPSDHDRRQPDAGPSELENYVAGDFAYDVGDEEYRERDVIL